MAMNWRDSSSSMFFLKLFDSVAMHRFSPFFTSGLWSSSNDWAIKLLDFTKCWSFFRVNYLCRRHFHDQLLQFLPNNICVERSLKVIMFFMKNDIKIRMFVYPSSREDPNKLWKITKFPLQNSTISCERSLQLSFLSYACSKNGWKNTLDHKSNKKNIDKIGCSSNK